MANWNDFKTTNPARFPLVGGVPAWDLSALTNAWNWLIDQGSLHEAWNARAEAIANITVTASPFVYVAPENEVVYVFGGAVSAMEKKDGAGAWQSIGVFSPAFLAAGQELRVTYSSAPTMRRDRVTALNNTAGSISTLSPSASPWTITNSLTKPILLRLSGGSVSNVTRLGVSVASAMPLTVILPPGGAVTITYSSAPTVVQEQ